MSWIAAAVAGAAVIGSVASSSAADKQQEAADKAAELQLQMAREANELQQGFYDQAQANQSPWLQSGGMANAALSGALGLGTEFKDQGGFDENGVRRYGASGSEMNATSDKFAGMLSGNFGDKDFTTDPSYQWRLEQGQKALEQSASARGGLLTGQAAADITNYGQNAASQEYQNAFGRYQTEQTNLYNRLIGVSTQGQNTAVQQGAQGLQAGANMANTSMGAASAAGNYGVGGANAAAAGMIGVGNSLSQGATNYAGWNYLNSSTPTQPTGPVAPGTEIQAGPPSNLANYK